MRKRSLIRVIEASTVMLFWLQASRVLFSVLFGVIYDTLFDSKISSGVVGLIAVFVFAALLAQAVTRRVRNGAARPNSRPDDLAQFHRWQMGLFVSVLVVAVARVPLSLDSAWLRLASAIVVVGAANVYLALLLSGQVAVFPVALVLALAVDQVARACGDTWDILLQPGFLPLQLVLCLGLLGVAWAAYSRKLVESPANGQLGMWGGLALGSFLFLQTAVLAQPNVLARWTGVAYEWVAPALLVATAFPLLFVAEGRLHRFGGRFLSRLMGWGVLARGGLLLGAVVLGLVIGRHLGGIPGVLALLFVQFLLVLTVPALPSLASAPLVARAPADAKLGGPAWAAGMICFFVLHLMFAFAFTYPYTIPAFRNSGLIILLVAGGIALLPIAFRPPDLARLPSAPVNNQVLVALALALIGVLVWSSPNSSPAPGPEPSGSVKVATYNIHYGYSTDWGHSLEDQAQAIEQSRADLVFLQEVDAGRITSYGVDNALWLARRLEMSVVFAPALEGLSGIALLTRLPLLGSDWALLPSELEQTAIVHAKLDLGEGVMDAYGVWLGLEEGERMRQVSAALGMIGDAETAVFGGDMNCWPDSPIYAMIENDNWIDPFVAMGHLPAHTAPALGPYERIDYVWARGMEPMDAQVSSSLASDHRLVVVELALNE